MAGESVALLGGRGTGQSAVMRMIAGLETPETGRILLNHIDITDLSPKHRGLTIQCQSDGLNSRKKVQDNILSGLLFWQMPRYLRKKKLHQMAEQFELQHCLKTKVEELSQSERLRVILARAVMSEAQICLLDNPFYGVVLEDRLNLCRELKGWQESLGISLLYATENIGEAQAVSDRMVHLDTVGAGGSTVPFPTGREQETSLPETVGGGFPRAARWAVG